LRSTSHQEAQLAGCAERPSGQRDCRCLCGNLLARVVGDRVELKCRRCKRTVLVPIAGVRRPALAELPRAPARKAGAP
jgi:hypothetical protein